MKKLFAGFTFGLILQAAIGPISLFIFSLSSAAGFIQTMPAVVGVTLADALFIFLAITGITAFLSAEKTANIFRIIGSIVVALFGILIIFESFGISLIPAISLVSNEAGDGAFLKGLFMTIGNPLTVVFWGGVCSVRMAEAGYDRPGMYIFGLGAALSTLICQTLIAALGSGINSMVSDSFLNWINFGVGMILIAMAVWPFVKKRRDNS